jgi:hypothetical protein
MEGNDGQRAELAQILDLRIDRRNKRKRLYASCEPDFLFKILLNL